MNYNDYASNKTFNEFFCYCLGISTSHLSSKIVQTGSTFKKYMKNTSSVVKDYPVAK